MPTPVSPHDSDVEALTDEEDEDEPNHHSQSSILSGEDDDNDDREAIIVDEEDSELSSARSGSSSPLLPSAITQSSKSRKSIVTATALRDSLQKWSAGKQAAPGGGNANTRSLLSDLTSIMSSGSGTIERAIQETNRGLKRTTDKPKRKPAVSASQGASHSLPGVKEKGKAKAKTTKTNSEVSSVALSKEKGKDKVSLFLSS